MAGMGGGMRLIDQGRLALRQVGAFFAALVPMLEKFRWHVETKTPPEADGKPGTTAAVRLMWPGASGETSALTQDDARTMDDLESARETPEILNCCSDLLRSNQLLPGQIEQGRAKQARVLTQPVHP